MPTFNPQPGDTVVLIAGGPNMSVFARIPANGDDLDSVAVIWFSSGTRNTATIPIVVLKSVSLL